MGPSTFRLSTTTVSMSLAGSCFFSESALGPFHHALDAAVAGKRRCRMHGGAPASPSRADLDLRPSLNTACMRQINFCLERDLLLRQALLVPSRVTCYLAFASL